MATRLSHLIPPKPMSRGYNQYSAKPPAKVRMQQLRENMHGCFLGPMDPSEFMRSFMLINSQSLEGLPGGIDFCQVYDQANEKLMYAPFVRRYVIPLHH